MFKQNKKLKSVFVVFIMTAITWSAFFNYVSGESGAPDVNGETSKVWYIEYGDHIVRQNETLTLNGDLIINSSGILDLSKVQLIINSTISNRYRIWVKPGGILYLLSSTIDSYDPNYSYECIIEGELYMKNCTVNNVWGNSGEAKGGVQIYSDSTIIDSKINGSSGTGIYINESAPTIYNTIISNCYYGIYYDGPSPSLVVSPSKVRILANRTVQFNATGGTQNYTWECSNTTVGTINSTGAFLGEQVGGCIITVRNNNSNIGKAELQVIPDPYTSMKLSPTYAVLNIDDDLKFNVTNGTQPYNWSVDNNTFGSIDQNGTYIANWTGISVVRVMDANNTTVSGLVEIDDMFYDDESSLLKKNMIKNNEIGILLNNVSPAITDTKFLSNEIGLKFINSSSFIYSCEFTNTNNSDLEVDDNSYPEVYLTTYDWSKISASDGDNDTMPNYFEYQYSLNQSTNDSALDADNDTLTNLEEFQNGTDPLYSDTDSDGLNDSAELDV